MAVLNIDHPVSIPQSEFCPLGLNWRHCNDRENPKVSIPQSEFCPLGPYLGLDGGGDLVGFNSSVGILSVGTASPNHRRRME